MEEYNEIQLKHFNHNIDEFIDCRIQCMRDVSEYCGLNITAPMCFGIGEVLNLIYEIDRTSKLPFFIVAGRNLNPELDYFNKLGMDAKVIEDVKDEQLFELVVKSIADNKPLIVFADRYYLPHIKEKSLQGHFGWHTVCVVGYRKNNNKLEYAITDYLSEDVVWIENEIFEQARNSTFQPFAPKGKCIIFNRGIKVEESIPELALKAIKNTCKKMLHDKDMGISAIRRFATDIRQVGELEQFSRLVQIQLRMMNKYCKMLEPTRSFYRIFFGQFLKELVDNYNIEFLGTFAEEITEIGYEWKEVGEILDGGNIQEVCLKLSNKFNQLVDIEQQYFERLYRSTLNFGNTPN